MTGGLVVLILALATDPIIFMLNLYKDPALDEIKKHDTSRMFNAKGMNTFELVVNEQIVNA